MNIPALREAVKAMEKTPDQKLNMLPGILKSTARKGKKAKFQFNHLGIRYLVRDEYGNICLRWLVSNGISGRQEVYYTKDFMSSTGRVLWRVLAGKINHT